MSERRMVAGLPSPFPIGSLLPGVYQDDDLAQRFTAGLDDVISAVICSVDCFDAYLDPLLAPNDFAAWLSTWVGVVLDDHWSLERQREVVRRAGELYAWRGTQYGIAELIRLYTGAVPTVHDSGGVTVSTTPGAAPTEAELSAAAPGPWVVVTFAGDDSDGIDLGRVGDLLAATKPAHVTAHVRQETR